MTHDLLSTVEKQGKTSRRGIAGWILFDWAQQPFHTLIITFVFAPYFAGAVAPDPTRGQELWGLATGIGGLLIALCSPILGAIADVSGPRKPWIFAFSVLGVAACGGLWFAVPGTEVLWPVLVTVALAVFAVEFAAVFNNAMMPDLVPRSELGRLSGTAWGLGYIGGLVALVLVLGFMAASPESGRTLFGLEPVLGLDPVLREGDRAAGPLTALWYVLFILPLFLFTADRPAKRGTGAVRQGMRNLAHTLRHLPSQRSYFSFLAASMFYRDALNALYIFGGIYAVGILGWSTIQIGLFGILANFTGALGAWTAGRMDQSIGSKTAVNIAILTLCTCCLVIISTTATQVLFIPLPAGSPLPDLVFFAAGAFIGAAGGATQAASRTLLVDQAPRAQVAEAFGLYALSGKATTFIGPLSVAAATALFSSDIFALSSDDAQRLGVTPIIVLFVIGLALLPFVKDDGGTVK